MEITHTNHPESLKEIAGAVLHYVIVKKPPEREVVAFVGGMIKDVLDALNATPIKRKIYMEAYLKLLDVKLNK